MEYKEWNGSERGHKYRVRIMMIIGSAVVGKENVGGRAIPGIM